MAVINGTSASETLTGTSAFDVIRGKGGNDVINGLGGGDALYGDEGNDIIDGGDGADFLYGGIGDDTLEGGLGNDWIVGEDGEDVLIGGLGDDTLIGGAHNDIFLVYGADGWDFFDGGDGMDAIGVDTSNPLITDYRIMISDIRDVELIIGEASGQTVIMADGFLDLTDVTLDNIKEIRGSTNDDLIYGSNVNLLTGLTNDAMFGYDGNDTLIGNNGQDELFGGNDDDVLNGGSGSDTMTGGSGNDVFVFNADVLLNTITDFQNNVDKIDMTIDPNWTNITTYSYMGGTLLEMKNGATIVSQIHLEGFDPFQIDPTDFIV